DGVAPFRNDTLRNFVGDRVEGECRVGLFNSTENWAALVNDSNWGLGVYHKGAFTFGGAFCGTPNVGGPSDSSAGYISPIHVDILDYNIAYEYEYFLILGSLEEIRGYVYANRRESRPDYRFERDRQHWYCVNCSDTGLPIQGKLRIKLEGDDPQLVGPPGFWQATDFPKLQIRAVYGTRRTVAEVFWKTAEDPDFSA